MNPEQFPEKLMFLLQQAMNAGVGPATIIGCLELGKASVIQTLNQQSTGKIVQPRFPPPDLEGKGG